MSTGVPRLKKTILCIKNKHTVFLEIVANSNFYLINRIFAAKTIQGRKLYEEIRYMPYRNGMQLNFLTCPLLS